MKLKKKQKDFPILLKKFENRLKDEKLFVNNLIYFI